MLTKGHGNSKTWREGHRPWNKGRSTPEETRKKQSLARLGKTFSPHSEETRSKISKTLLGHTVLTQTREKLSKAHSGKVLSEDHKKNIRLSTIAYIEQCEGPMRPRSGRHEYELLNKQELIDHCKIVRQYHLKKLGYFVDGYCPETNTVYEVYEPWHRDSLEKDEQRENEIRNHLKCNFKVLWDNNKNKQQKEAETDGRNRTR